MLENQKIKNYYSKLDHSLLSRERVRSSEDDHHLEFVDEINGVTFIDDSKSVGLSFTKNSIEAVESKVILIIGGDDKENNYSVLSSVMKQKVVALICLGNSNEKILKDFSSTNLLFAKASSIKEAVQFAFAMAYSGDSVLFSPASQSWDVHHNYKNRGNEFKEMVKNIAKDYNWKYYGKEKK